MGVIENLVQEGTRPGLSGKDLADEERRWDRPVIAKYGSTYYANSSNDAGAPNMLPVDAMSGDSHLAAVPELATLALLVLGAGLLGRRRR